jgi:hypothetical protein
LPGLADGIGFGDIFAYMGLKFVKSHARKSGAGKA